MYDIVKVNKGSDFAIATDKRIDLIKVDLLNLIIKIIPFKLKHNHSEILKIRDNILLISDLSTLHIYDVLNQKLLCHYKNM